MEKYNYQECVCEDIREYLKNHGIIVTTANREELEDNLRDDLMQEDSVTGNASGSYTCNYWRAEENICHNLDLLQDAADEYGCDLGEWIKGGAETCDVVIRCYLVPSCLSDVLDEVEIDVEDLQELADYINEADGWPENIREIIEANGWEDLTDEENNKICRDGCDILMFDKNRKAYVESEEED